MLRESRLSSNVLNNTIIFISAVIGGSCTSDADCTGSVANSVCGSDSKCACGTGYKANAGLTACNCKKMTKDNCFNA